MREEVQKAIELLKRNNGASLEEALTLLQQSVFSFSMHVCGQREDAEDTMQEVLLKSVPYLSKFESPKALVVWLYRVAKNRCLMSRRRSKFAPKQELSLEELMPDRQELETLVQGGVNPETFAIHSQEARWLREAIHKLPAHYRIVLVLRDMEGLTDKEVAEISGLRTGTVRVRLHRSRLFVRKELMKQKLVHGRRRLPVLSRTMVAPEPRPSHCKAMFAELSNYLDEQLDDSMCDELEKHLNGCEPCQAFLASLQATIEQCRKSPAECPNPRNAAKLRKQILKNYSRIASIRS
jgi:RNA polymerase sigma-70 factor, ECF subfamily